MEIWYSLVGPIDVNTSGQFIGWVNSQVLQTQPVKKLKIFLSSGGGDMDSAIRIYHYIKGLPFDVDIIGFGQVDSAANTIFVAGNKRIGVKGCRFFLHEGLYTVGNPTAPLSNHEETMRVLNDLKNRNIDILVTETGKSRSDIEDVLKEGKIFSAEEAKKFGLVSEVVDRVPVSKDAVQPITAVVAGGQK